MLAMTAVVGVLGATGILIAARKTIDSVGRVAGVSEHLSPGGSAIENFLLVGSDSRAVRIRRLPMRAASEPRPTCRVTGATRS